MPELARSILFVEVALSAPIFFAQRGRAKKDFRCNRSRGSLESSDVLLFE
jgi:hypothetical protein